MIELGRGSDHGGPSVARRAARRGLVVLLCGAALAFAVEAVYRATLYLDAARQGAGTAFELYAVGESTMVGEPFHPKISVPRLLEHMFGGKMAGRPMVTKILAERGVPLYPQSVAFDRALEGRTPGPPGVVLIMS